jgi:hypothetical protein
MARHIRAKTVAAVTLATLGTALLGTPAYSGAAPASAPVQARYVADGTTVGSGTVVEYAGQPYVPLGAVKVLTGTQLHWDPATATLSAGAPGPAQTGGTYLEALAGQPYYTSSTALCWQVTADDLGGQMHSPYASGSLSPCNEGLSKRPMVAGQGYAHNIALLVSADGRKAPDAHNTLTLSYDLNGRYTTFTGTVGLVDSPFNRDPMQLTLLGDGRTLGSALLTPGGLPASFKVSVARVRQLTIRLSNVSGAAPNLITACCYQYAPGAVLIANPRLAG